MAKRKKSNFSIISLIIGLILVIALVIFARTASNTQTKLTQNTKAGGDYCEYAKGSGAVVDGNGRPITKDRYTIQNCSIGMPVSFRFTGWTCVRTHERVGHTNALFEMQYGHEDNRQVVDFGSQYANKNLSNVHDDSVTCTNRLGQSSDDYDYDKTLSFKVPDTFFTIRIEGENQNKAQCQVEGYPIAIIDFECVRSAPTLPPVNVPIDVGE